MTDGKSRLTGISGLSGVWMWIALATVAGLPYAPLALAADTAEWVQYRGPNRDNISPETTAWPAKGPKKLWEVNLGGIGYGSLTIAKDRIYTTGNSGKNLSSATTYCLDATTGKTLWEYTINTTKKDVAGVTPSIAGNRVITAGPGGELACLNAETGAVVWEAPLGITQAGIYCYGASPLVHKDKVIVLAGSTIRAFALADGKELWKTDWMTPPGGGRWASPVLGTFDGQETVVCVSRSNMVGLSPADGKMLWKQDFEKNPNGEDLFNTPTVSGNHIVCIAYRVAGARSTRLTCVEIKNNKAEQIWKSEILTGQRSQSPIVRNNCVYLTSDIFPVNTPQDAKGQLICYDLQTGKVLWKSNAPQSRGPLPPAGKKIWIDGGAFMMAGDNMIILDGTGHIEMANVSAKGCTVLGDADFVDSALVVSDTASPSGNVLTRSGFQFITPPLLLNGRLYVRNHERVACYNLQ